jgi:hypothetical protein
MSNNFWIKNILFPSKKMCIFKISHILVQFFNPGTDQNMGSNSKNVNGLQ